MKPTLYLVRGVSGAGKSTFAMQLWSAGIVERIFEADDFFYNDGVYLFNPTRLSEAHRYCQLNTKYVLEKGKSVVVSNTSTTEFEVMVYETIAKEANAHFVSIIVENRHNGVNIHNVPEDKIKQMKGRFSVKL